MTAIVCRAVNSCHPERSEGPMQLACSVQTATYIGPSRKHRAQDDKVFSVWGRE
jgi:hypothetical protein